MIVCVYIYIYIHRGLRRTADDAGHVPRPPARAGHYLLYVYDYIIIKLLFNF